MMNTREAKLHSLQFANIFRRLFVILSLFAAVSYSTASFCFASNEFSFARASYTKSRGAVTVVANVSGAVNDTTAVHTESLATVTSGTVLPTRPESTELNVIEQTQTVTLHCDNSSQSPVEIPEIPHTEVVRKNTAVASSYVSYTELDNKFFDTVKSLQTLK